MTKRGRISGDSYFVTREEPGKPYLCGRATSPVRANRLAEKYRYLPAARGTTVTVQANIGAKWVPWVYHGESTHNFNHGWKREPLRIADGYVYR